MGTHFTLSESSRRISALTLVLCMPVMIQNYILKQDMNYLSQRKQLMQRVAFHDNMILFNVEAGNVYDFCQIRKPCIIYSVMH